MGTGQKILWRHLTQCTCVHLVFVIRVRNGLVSNYRHLIYKYIYMYMCVCVYLCAVQVLHYLAVQKPSDLTRHLLPCIVHAAILKVKEEGECTQGYSHEVFVCQCVRTSFCSSCLKESPFSLSLTHTHTRMQRRLRTSHRCVKSFLRSALMPVNCCATPVLISRNWR